MKLSLINVVCVFMIAFVLFSLGGGIELSYASESSSVVSADVPAESSANENFFIRAFHSVTNLITSFFSWSIDTFGNVVGRILGWLGVGTPALFILWVIKQIIGFFANKHIFFPLKRKVNKHAVDMLGTNVFKNEAVEYKRPLTKKDIVYITDKYGYVKPAKIFKYKDGHEIYTEWTPGWLTWYGIFFCDDGVRTYKGLWANEEDFMSYDELRNADYISIKYLKNRYEGFPDDFFNTLMELRED